MNFSGFPDYLKKCSHIFGNDKFIKVIQDFAFINVSEKNEFPDFFEKKRLINQNIQNSKVIMINKNDLFNKITKNEVIILCFEKTLIILKQSLISSVYTLLSNNPNLSVCFLKNTKEIFTEQIANPIIDYDENFKEEIESFNKSLCLYGKVNYFKFWPFVSSCISGYLIKKSYFKLSNDRIQSFNEFMNNHFSLGKIKTDDYIELRTLGCGLFIVKLIYHIDRGELFALKKPNSIDKDIPRLIKRENDNYEKIHHPFIPKFYGIVEYDHFDCLIIEFINGETLNECQFDGYNENDIIQIIFELLLIVEHFHFNNFLIRDMKPNNLMITKQKEIVMIDFDRIIDKSIQAQSHDLNNECNEYAAPEVKADELFSEKSDIYSLAKVIEFILNRVYPKMKKSEMNDIIEKCFQYKVEKRPSIKEIICHFLVEFQNLSSSLSILNFPRAQFYLGVIYSTGEYVERDINKAIYYYSLASNQNYPQAQFNLGIIYSRGEYVERDMNKAIYFYSLAANQNIPQAQFNLGLIYETGEYVKQDINKAIYYYSLASNQYYPQAQFNLGLIYETFEYVKRDINKAIYYYSLASNQNYSQAQYNLGIIYYSGLYCKKDIHKGKQYIMLSSYYEYRIANFSHGFLLHKENKIIEAIHYYKEASSFNIQYAKNNLGIIYKHGFGEEVPKRIGNSIVYFEEAIRQKNDILSMYNLAHIHIYEETIKQDIDKSIELLIKSSNEFKHSLILLCIVLIKRSGFDKEQIQSEIDKRNVGLLMNDIDKRNVGLLMNDIVLIYFSYHL